MNLFSPAVSIFSGGNYYFLRRFDLFSPAVNLFSPAVQVRN
jgi:hypothetical protein